ncbi:hypothetical protein LSH36_123g04032 [Paralvinella palmiformis]|uniref:SUEL-type lectin domain-containing protein n=1 Tax=Paralvinella palmiformis TaxID=53620 RepID=A0AAD9JYC3_9ANNE|nr:hypothetical protein LSH36_123g04032 [Paralvinella palmiformis]
MRVGRCLSTDYYTGCQANVIDHMDERCSGRQRCTIRIPDPKLSVVQPCRKDLVAYLEADYDCVPAPVLLGRGIDWPKVIGTVDATSVNRVRAVLGADWLRPSRHPPGNPGPGFPRCRGSPGSRAILACLFGSEFNGFLIILISEAVRQ